MCLSFFWFFIGTVPYNGPQMSLENAWLRLGKAVAEGVFKTQVVINGKVIQMHDILQIWHLIIIYTGLSSDTFISKGVFPRFIFRNVHEIE